MQLTALRGYESWPTFPRMWNQVAFEWIGPRDDNADIHVKLVDSPALRWLTSGPQADTAPQLDDV